MTNLVIVESPAKAKTIEGYLGDNYKVIASFGHVRDMADKDGAVVPKNWEKINWSLSERGKSQLKEITTLAKNSNTIILATDPDREGEAIAWHILELLKERGLVEDKEILRAVFNSITKKAVTDAMSSMRDLNYEKIEAYLARRVLDYVVGFNISPLLWRRLPGAKSAGRVQSVALKLICDREEEREKFKPKEYWSLEAVFHNENKETILSSIYSFEGERIKRMDLSSEQEAKRIEIVSKEEIYKITDIKSKPTKRNPRPPFITSSMQREASSKLGFSPEHTMRIAQSLYEKAHITYMRTDSVSMSEEGLHQTRELITSKFGNAFLSPDVKIYKSKSKQAQEGHEAIRPTNLSMNPDEIVLSGDEKRLYELIWNRALASQMKSAEIEQTDIFIEGKKTTYKATGSVVTFKGFLEVYKDSAKDSDKESSNIFPSNIKINDELYLDAMNLDQHFTKPPARFNEASLIKELEERGIGRPSTYASIMNSIKRRDYARLENKQLIPESKGRVVVTFLDLYFTDYFKYEFTAEMEESLDLIARGSLEWKDLLDKFWDGFEPNISKVLDLSNREVIDDLNHKLHKQLFPLGDKCPRCDKYLTLKNSPRYGPFIGCTAFDETGCDYKRPTFLSKEAEEAIEKSKDSIGVNPDTNKEIFLKPSRGGGFYLESENSTGESLRQTLPLDIVENMEEELAILWINLPRKIGPHPDSGEMIEAGYARGPFVRVKRESKETYQYANIPKDEDIFNMGMNRAVELLASKGVRQDEERELGIDPISKVPVFLKTGRFGSYVETDELIRKTVPKDMSDAEISLDWALSNLPIYDYHPKDSKPIGLRRQRTRNKGWKAFIVHSGNKAEIPKDIKIKDIDKEIAFSVLEDFYKED
tara:strand:- start:24186 stop:26813 length:2628 start_codon:yes stop_codon:yes gene_type:complete